MDRESIDKQLASDVARLFDRIDVVDEIDSTNAELARRIRNDDAGTQLLIARSQTAGRGRRGRNWSSPQDGGIYMSLCRPVAAEQSTIQGLSLVTAISVLSVVQAMGAVGVQLKWPNDVLVGKQKLAGILLEMVAGPSVTTIIFGIGINLQLPQVVRQGIGRPVTELASLIEGEINREAVVASIVESLITNMQKFEEEGFVNFQQTWNSNDRYLDQDIVIEDGNRQMIGRSLGVDTDGALILQTASGRERISGGEIFPSLKELSEVSS